MYIYIYICNRVGCDDLADDLPLLLHFARVVTQTDVYIYIYIYRDR